MSFLHCLKTRAIAHENPFRHWEFDSPLTSSMIEEIYNSEIDDPNELNLSYDGTRAIDGGKGRFRKGISDGGKAFKFRCFVTPENQTKFPSLFSLIEEMRKKETYEYIGNLIGKDLSHSYVRAEIICDRKGFWLKPHCDIKEKLLSCLVFVNRNGESEDLGTDLYDTNLKKVKTVPYKNNYGYFFTSAEDTWHGLEKKDISQERRCLQLNYVTFDKGYLVEK